MTIGFLQKLMTQFYRTADRWV